MTLQAYAPLPDETVVAAAETVVAEPALTERVAKLVAGVGLVGYARAALEHAGHAATISGNRITVDHEVEAQARVRERALLVERLLQRRHAAGVDRRHPGGAARLRRRVVSDLLDRGAAMGPPAEVADQGAPARLTSFPVFYDKTGKRLRRVVCSAVLGVVVVLCVVAVAAARFLPAAIHSVRNTNSDSTFARQRLQENANATMLPMVGDGPLSRMVKVVRDTPAPERSPAPIPPCCSQCRCRMMTATEYRTMWTATEYRTRRSRRRSYPSHHRYHQ